MRKQSGFTLIELVVVIAVLAILAGVAIPKFLDLTTQAKMSALQADLGTIRTGIMNVAVSASVNATGGHQALTASYPTDLGQGDTTSVVFTAILEPSAQNDFFARGWRATDATHYTNANYNAIGPINGVTYGPNFVYGGNTGATAGQFK